MVERPDNFERVARNMSPNQAAHHYRRHWRTIRKWALSCGGGLYEEMLMNGKIRKGHPRYPNERKAGDAGLLVNEEDQRVMQFLRIKTRWVCYSSRIYQNENRGVIYHVGNRKLDRHELLDLATRYGWGAEVEQD